jgi:hypothetical protein
MPQQAGDSMRTRKVKRIYPMQMAMMILLDHAHRPPAAGRRARMAAAILIRRLADAQTSRF